MAMKKKKKKAKYIDKDQFKHFFSQNAFPVKLEGGAIPNIFSRFDKEKKIQIFASGYQNHTSGNYDPEYNGIRFGGIDIYRDATKEPEPFNYNVDSYGIIKDNTTGNKIILTGKERPVNHWTDQIASGLQNVEVFYYKSPRCPICGVVIPPNVYSCLNCNYAKKL